MSTAAVGWSAWYAPPMLHRAPRAPSASRQARAEALALLAAGEPIMAVYRQTGIARSTLRRWSADTPPVAPLSGITEAVEAVTAARIDALHTAAANVERCTAAASEMIDVLLEVARDVDADPHARIRAASTLLDRGGVVASQRVAVVVAAMTPSELSAQILAIEGPAPSSNREAVAK